ncbi:(Fe-S)-binding protein [Candidatus Woesearchaeota archaeon]|nr:(Fe-S)-binding protein [Candidatus Woesearchaeota archaeon]
MKSDKNKKVENCNLCGFCNLSCPTYKVLMKESAGPRFKAFLARKKDYKEVFFLCTECGACIQECPADVELECLKIREELVKNGFETPANKVMQENIKLYGNPFGEIKKGKKIKQYYT